MKAPHLNRALVLEGVLRTADGAGGFTEAWTALGTLWAEVLPGSGSDVLGGYGMVQYSLFDTRGAGDLDVFVRYDAVSVGQEAINRRARQAALRTGVNYNLPHTNKLMNLHFEYAHNSINGKYKPC